MNLPITCCQLFEIPADIHEAHISFVGSQPVSGLQQRSRWVILKAKQGPLGHQVLEAENQAAAPATTMLLQPME
jgi:hypothetical protein